MAKVPPDPDLNQHLAADLIRQKIDKLHANAPSAKLELEAAKSAMRGRSKHQQFMHELSSSGRSLAEIQTAWHNYYSDLPDSEKHIVWQEFYALHGNKYARGGGPQTPQTTTKTNLGRMPANLPKTALKSVADIKRHILKTLAANNKLTTKHHLKSLVFGLGMGGVAVFILLFGFFNERFIAPFISPSKNVSSTPVIIDPSATEGADANPKIIIPKINVEVPVVYDSPSTDEKSIQTALERGVVHYGISPKPGEQGNAVIVGHSSNNILNQGRYKFAFVLLKRLEIGDTFIINKDSKRYVYKVYDKKIVSPTDFSVLDLAEKAATVTLITCDPPGTSTNRLIVVGEQIIPDPSANLASSAAGADNQLGIIPGNAPSLWQRLKNWLFG